MINKFSEDYVSGFSHGYVRAEAIGRKITKDACSQLGTAVLDNLLDVMDGYAAKGYDVIPVDDVKMEVCLCIGRLFRKPETTAPPVAADEERSSSDSVDLSDSQIKQD